MKAFACKACSGIASTGATSNDKDLSLLLRVRCRKSVEEDTVTVSRPLVDEKSACSDELGSFNLPLKYVSVSWFCFISDRTKSRQITA